MNKKITFLILGTLLVAVLISSIFIFSDKKGEENNAPTQSVTESDYLHNINLNKRFTLDEEYIARRKAVTSNVELGYLNAEFTEKWKSKIDLYNKKLLDYFISEDNKKLEQQTRSMITEWENYYASKMAYYNDYLLAIYTTGSIVPIEYTQYEMLLVRDRAIEMFEMWAKTCQPYDADDDPLILVGEQATVLLSPKK